MRTWTKTRRLLIVGKNAAESGIENRVRRSEHSRRRERASGGRMGHPTHSSTTTLSPLVCLCVRLINMHGHNNTSWTLVWASGQQTAAHASITQVGAARGRSLNFINAAVGSELLPNTPGARGNNTDRRPATTSENFTIFTKHLSKRTQNTHAITIDTFFLFGVNQLY